VSAQQKITFDDAIAIALRQNTALKQAENTASLSGATVAQRKNALLPTLSLSSSSAQNIGRNFNASEGAVITQTTQSASLGLSSAVTLFDGLRNVRQLEQARLDESASNSELTRAKQTTVFTVASDFLTLVTAQGQLAVQRENLAAQEAQEKQLSALVAAGARPISDLYVQQATTASARSNVVTSERSVELGRIALIQTLQLDPRGTFDFVSPTAPASSNGVRQFALDSLLDRAFAARTDLMADATRVDAATQGAKAATAGRLPTVSLSAGYNTAYSSATALSLADQLNQRRGGSIGIGVSFPIFDRGATNIATQQAKIQEDNARLALQNTRQTIALEVRRAYLDYESTKQQLTAALAQQKAADLAVSATQQRYQIGSSTLLELTQARASQLQAASAVVTARYTLAFQQALMSYYTGDLVPGAVTFAE
jgi:outer membrane protein